MGFDASRGISVGLLGSVAAIALPGAAWSADRIFDIPAQPVSTAVALFARQGDVQVLIAGSAAEGRATKALQGAYSVQEGLKRLLRGTGLSVRMTGASTYVVGAQSSGEAMAGSAAASDESAEVVVTGTRIRGGSTPSPVTQITREDIDRSGFSDLGQVIRSIPQNFAGGQNPGIGIGTGNTANQNDTGGSAFNLRGLGPDATLTLLNGHRVSYDGIAQSVDASAIPIAALERIEIVTDGASAIYGSDAVAGVANIILKRDFQGITASALVGGATDGGQFTRQFSATTGGRWNTGGLLLAYDFKNSAAIYGHQRDYTAYLDPRATIYPGLLQHSVVLAGHQQLIEGLEFNVDANFMRRRQTSAYVAYGTAITNRDHATVFTVSPSLDAKLANGWSLSLRGTYGRDRGKEGAFYTSGGVARSSRSCYCNDTKSVELNAEGALLRLPGGDVRVALGAGYRQIGYQDTSNGPLNTHLGDYYLFGEARIPIVSPDLAIPGVRSLNASAALRYEDYPQIDKVATPKFGLVYEPTADVSIKGTWSRSFKAPTVAQRTTPAYGLLYNASDVGGAGYPATATVLAYYGGDTPLKPERARSWTTTLELHPRELPGFRLTGSYFNIVYKDRVVMPIGVFDSTLLTYPPYAPFITYNPSAAQIAAILATPGRTFYNESSNVYDPNQVIALVNDNNTNAANQKIHGIDLSGSYRFAALAGFATVDGSASWLNERQTNDPSLPSYPVAGRIYTPAKFRARGGLSWDNDALATAVFLNYVGSVQDIRFAPIVGTGSFTTVDATIRYRTAAGHTPLSGVEVSLAVQNLFNQAPPIRPVLASFQLSYDSTNYSAIGRFISLSLTKHW